MSYEPEYIWLEGRMMPSKNATVHFLTSSLHYGTAVFEGIRSYKSADGPAVFRLKDHLRRLFKSATIMGLTDIPYDEQEMYQAVLKLIQINKLESCYIRPLIYIKEGGWNLSTQNVKIEAGIAAWPWADYLGSEAISSGVRANVSSFPRHHPNITMTKGKIAGNYVNSVLAKTESVRAGFDEAIMLDPQGNVSECTGENIFIVRDGIIYTPPRNSVLEGITRDTLITLARWSGLQVIEEIITRDQLYIADEVFVSGTAAEVIALREIDHRKIGNGKTGEVCAHLQNLYRQTVHGELDEFRHWNNYVYQEEFAKLTGSG